MGLERDSVSDLVSIAGRMPKCRVPSSAGARESRKCASTFACKAMLNTLDRMPRCRDWLSAGLGPAGWCTGAVRARRGPASRPAMTKKCLLWYGRSENAHAVLYCSTPNKPMRSMCKPQRSSAPCGPFRSRSTLYPRLLCCATADVSSWNAQNNDAKLSIYTQQSPPVPPSK